MSYRMRLIYAAFAGYLADFTFGWLSVWLAPHTGDFTYRFYMAPGDWFVDPMKAPFVALLFWTSLFGAAWYYLAPLMRSKSKSRTPATA